MTLAADWTATSGAVTGIVSTAIAVIAAVVAQRYLQRGSVTVEATMFGAPGRYGLHVRPSIKSQGVSPLRLPHATPDAPTIRLAEYSRSRGELDGVQKETFRRDDIVGPGETATDSEIFVVADPADDTIGWRVTLVVTVPRRVFKDWIWTAVTFVPVPEPRPRSGPRRVSSA